jgi:ABC-type polysaccharide/polyol phosphate export permease
MISAAFVISFDRGDPIIYFNSAATFILSGVFYPTSVLGPKLEYISGFIPIKHVIEISRSLAFDEVDYNIVNNGIISLFLLSIIFLFIGLLACNLSINRAKKLGTFGNY